jgi:hypothetical protein
MEYLVTTWTLDSDGTPHLTAFSYKTYESAIKKYDDEKNNILEKSKNMQYTFLKLDTEEKYENYTDNIDEYKVYVIEQNCYDVMAFFQDCGWKRPIGVSLKCVNKNNESDLNWSTNLTCYPIMHGGQW